MAEPQPNNLLIILCDQLRRDALGCYGDQNVSTPNLDRLADQGVRFDCANSTYPICVPFRFSMMTGEYAHSRMVPGIEWRMSPAERTLADEFNDAGYESIYVGKWHLYGGHLHQPGYGARRVNREPVPRRFQGRWKHWRGFELRNDPFDTCYFVDDDPTPRPIQTYQTDGLFDLAMEQMRRQHQANHPFVCALSVEPPHPPYSAPPQLEAKWSEREITLPPNFAAADEQERQKLLHQRRIYYAMVENLDANVGRMMRFLDQTNLAQDTAVVFLSDHGELNGAHQSNGKQQPYEESAGIPLIVRDPTSPSRPGRVIEAPTNTEDLFPTFLGMMGLKPTNSVPGGGADLSPLIRDETVQLDREGVLLEFVSELRPEPIYHEATYRGVRTRQYKYIVMGDLTGAKPWQLFDLDQDPHEMHNLLDQDAHHDLGAHHHHLLRQLLIDTEDPYPLAPAYGWAGLNLY